MSLFGWICLGLMVSMLVGVFLGVALWPRQRRVEFDVMQQPFGDQPRLPPGMPQ